MLKILATILLVGVFLAAILSFVGRRFDKPKVQNVAFYLGIWILVLGTIGWRFLTAFFNPVVELGHVGPLRLY